MPLGVIAWVNMEDRSAWLISVVAHGDAVRVCRRLGAQVAGKRGRTHGCTVTSAPYGGHSGQALVGSILAGNLKPGAVREFN